MSFPLILPICFTVILFPYFNSAQYFFSFFFSFSSFSVFPSYTTHSFHRNSLSPHHFLLYYPFISPHSSLNGWATPIILTLFGPFRNWLYPKILRSNKVTNATLTNVQITKIVYLINLKSIPC